MLINSAEHILYDYDYEPKNCSKTVKLEKCICSQGLRKLIFNIVDTKTSRTDDWQYSRFTESCVCLLCSVAQILQLSKLPQCNVKRNQQVIVTDKMADRRSLPSRLPGRKIPFLLYYSWFSAAVVLGLGKDHDLGWNTPFKQCLSHPREPAWHESLQGKLLPCATNPTITVSAFENWQHIAWFTSEYCTAFTALLFNSSKSIHLTGCITFKTEGNK